MIPSVSELQPLMPEGFPCTGVDPLTGDGSVRRFFRVRSGADSFVLCHGPDTGENAAWVRLAGYLRDRGVRVPQVHGTDPARGWVLMEDLGDRNLFQAVGECRVPDEVLALYRPVLGQLVTLQVAGGGGYDPKLGQFPEPYGVRVMVEEEGMYFAREFAHGLLGLEVPDGYRRDVERLAEEGALAPAGHLLHRDFQSRNIQLAPAGPAIIDFQGCRFGPLAYDVAALLLDPYVALSSSVRERLLGEYRLELTAQGVDPGAFDAGWLPVGAFRLLQALGAFAKLGGRFGKPGFLEHAATGLEHLAGHLGEAGGSRYPDLFALVSAARGAWERSPSRP